MSRSFLLLFLTVACRSSDSRFPSEEWRAYGGDSSGQRYSTLNDIRPQTVTRLAPAWTYRTGETLPPRMAAKAAFESTPLFVNGRLFVTTPSNRVIALDGATGKELWVFDPKVPLDIDYSEVTSRGVAYWNDRRQRGACSERLFFGTIDARLISIDAITGIRCEAFSRGGEVNLLDGIANARKGEYQITSAPAVVDDLVVVGSAVGDNGAAELERGVVRAYDTRTGALRWQWDPTPRGEGVRTGAANAWGTISVDPERYLVFVPTSSPSPDYFGGQRPGANQHANSIVALRARDGSVVWSFQVVHHDLWDYDIASQPVLFDFPGDNGPTAAVAVGTKMGLVFVLDRETGEPLIPVEERLVPASSIAEEHASPTQPFPAFPPPLVPHRLSAGDAWGINEVDREECGRRIASLRSEGIYTPPGTGGSVVVPGNAGGIHWGGMTYDRERGILVANTNRVPFEVRLIPRADYDPSSKEGERHRLGGEFGRMTGTPYGMFRVPLLASSGLPCSAPPWGGLTAISFRDRRVLWDVPLGFIPKLEAVPGFESFGSFNFGGAITAGGLVFVAASMDPNIRAFDIVTGKELWRGALPVPAQATPMTYRAGGKQFLVIAAGGHGKLGTPQGDSVVAFAVAK